MVLLVCDGASERVWLAVVIQLVTARPKLNRLTDFVVTGCCHPSGYTRITLTESPPTNIGKTTARNMRGVVGSNQVARPPHPLLPSAPVAQPNLGARRIRQIATRPFCRPQREYEQRERFGSFRIHGGVTNCAPPDHGIILDV